MDVSRETPDVTTKPTCYDLTNMLVCSVTCGMLTLNMRASEVVQSTEGRASLQIMFIAHRLSAAGIAVYVHNMYACMYLFICVYIYVCMYVGR